jgi:hypothetical protein
MQEPLARLPAPEKVLQPVAQIRPAATVAEGKFKPEYAGKLNFYCNVVNDRLKRPDDQPTIGLILCQARGRLLASTSPSAFPPIS